MDELDGRARMSRGATSNKGMHPTRDTAALTFRQGLGRADKVWFTVDGCRVFSCNHYSHFRAQVRALNCGPSLEGARSALREVGVFRPRDFGEAMRAYLDMAVTEALKSSDPFIKAFAVVDRRVGRRRLAQLELSLSEAGHPLVRAFYELRVSSTHV